MIEYIEHKGKKIPFSITMSTLIEFKNTRGTDFETAISTSSTDIPKLFENVLLITILGIKKGYELSNYPFYKKFWNYIRYGNTMGVAKSSYIRIVDENYINIIELIPKFFLSLGERDKKK